MGLFSWFLILKLSWFIHLKGERDENIQLSKIIGTSYLLLYKTLLQNLVM